MAASSVKPSAATSVSGRAVISRSCSILLKCASSEYEPRARGEVLDIYRFLRIKFGVLRLGFRFHAAHSTHRLGHWFPPLPYPAVWARARRSSRWFPPAPRPRPRRGYSMPCSLRLHHSLRLHRSLSPRRVSAQCLRDVTPLSVSAQCLRDVSPLIVSATCLRSVSPRHVSATCLRSVSPLSVSVTCLRSVSPLSVSAT